MFRPGPLEIGLIAFIVLILFGAGKLPQVASQLGRGIRAFRRGQTGTDEEDTEEETVEPRPKRTTGRKKATSKGS